MILPMSHVQLLGPRDLLPAALAHLQAQGALDLRAPPPEDAYVHPVAAGPGGPELERVLAEALRRLDALAARLPPVPAGATAATADERLRPGVAALAEALPAALEGAERDVGAVEARRAALAAEREATARFSRLVVALSPLEHGVDPALQPEYHGLVLRNEPEALALLRAEVRRITGDVCEVAARPLDAETTGVLVVVPRASGRALAALLFERGVDEVRLPPSYAGKPLFEVLLLLAGRERELPAELAAADAALAVQAARVAAMRAEVREALELARARRRCGETRFAFVVTGYMPEERVAALRAATAARFGDAVAVLARPPERAEWGSVPVVLRNRPAVRPFELLLALVALPRYGSVDATPWLAVFFPLFFGLVLGDVAFGVLGIALALAARARGGWGGPVGRDVAWIALWCSISATAFGVLFGEALGELGAHVGLHPVLLDRRRAVMTFFAVAVAVGGVHVATGLALGAVSALRRGHRREALGRAAKLLLLVAGGVAAAALAGALPRAVVRPSLLTAVALLGASVVAEGPMAVLELVLAVGNVLSYARLMALGLASVMLAEAANVVGATLEPAALGIAVAVLLHAVNFTLGLVSPTIAALRLHYVEFFEKFYDEGGAPYRPFALSG
ncbi:MAG TPA: ATPase [Anaeromyxobacter sp.]|nr:ATPase [Anaeromyxobacter sp.]